MASAALSAPEKQAGWSAEQRQGGAAGVPMTVSAVRAKRRIASDEHKKALLMREEEKERRRIEETIRRLDAIEEQRRRAKERELDREKRRVEFTTKIGRSTLVLQRYERGRQARRKARVRARAVVTIAAWMTAKIRQAAMIKAIKNRAILKMMVQVETTIEGRIQEACFVVKNRLALRHFQQNRSARIIQKRVRDRAILVRQAAAILVRAIRRWFVRTKCRRECIRKSILRHRGSLSRRDLGIPELEPAPLTLTATNALLARAGGIPQEGRWWDTGAPVVPRPRWGNARVENEEARSRLRAASLADLIRTSEKRSPKTAARTMVGAEVDSKWRHEKHVNSDDSDGADSPSSFRRKRSRVGNGRGRLHGTRSMKSLSMIDAREAEKAAWEHEMERRKIKREAGLLNLDRKKKLSVFEKHLYRQRDFEVQKEKRVLAAEKEVLRREKLKALEVAKIARRKHRQADQQKRAEEERQHQRYIKIHAYEQKKAAREGAEKKARAAKRKEARRANEVAEAKRLAADALFQKQNEDRVTRARRKRRAEEEQARLRESAAQKRAREAMEAQATAKYTAKTTMAATTLSKQALASTASAQRTSFKNPARSKNRTVLAPIDIGNRKTRRRKRARLPGHIGDASAAPQSRVAAGAWDGRLEAPQSIAIPALPVVPAWQAMSTGASGDPTTRRLKRRLQKLEGSEGAREHGEREDGHRKQRRGQAGRREGRGRRGGARREEYATSGVDEALRDRVHPAAGADLEWRANRRRRRKKRSCSESTLSMNAAAASAGGILEISTSDFILDADGKSSSRFLLHSTTDTGKGSESSPELLGTSAEPGYLPEPMSTSNEPSAEVTWSTIDEDNHWPLSAEGDEPSTMETLDSAFPVPGPGAESGGGGGLGATSEPEKRLSPGWSSCSSRCNSEQSSGGSGDDDDNSGRDEKIEDRDAVTRSLLNESASILASKDTAPSDSGIVPTEAAAVGHEEVKPLSPTSSSVAIVTLGNADRQRDRTYRGEERARQNEEPAVSEVIAAIVVSDAPTELTQPNPDAGDNWGFAVSDGSHTFSSKRGHAEIVQAARESSPQGNRRFTSPTRRSGTGATAPSESAAPALPVSKAGAWLDEIVGQVAAGVVIQTMTAALSIVGASPGDDNRAPPASRGSNSLYKNSHSMPLSAVTASVDVELVQSEAPRHRESVGLVKQT